MADYLFTDAAKAVLAYPQRPAVPATDVPQPDAPAAGAESYDNEWSSIMSAAPNAPQSSSAVANVPSYDSEWGAIMGGNDTPEATDFVEKVTGGNERKQSANRLRNVRMVADYINSSQLKLQQMPEGPEKDALQTKLDGLTKYRSETLKQYDTIEYQNSPVHNQLYSQLPQFARRYGEGALGIISAATDLPFKAIGLGGAQHNLREAVDAMSHYNDLKDKETIFGPFLGQIEAGLTKGTLAAATGGLGPVAVLMGYDSAERVYRKTGNLGQAARQGAIDALITYIGGRVAHKLGGFSNASAAGIGDAAANSAETSGLRQFLTSTLVGGGQGGTQELMTIGNDLLSGEKITPGEMAKRIANASAMGAAQGAVPVTTEAIKSKIQQFRTHLAANGRAIESAIDFAKSAKPEQLGNLHETTTAKEFAEATGLKGKTQIFRDAFVEKINQIRQADPAKYAADVFNENTQIRRISDMERIARLHVADEQRATQEVENLGKEYREAVPDESRRAAMTNALEAGHDAPTLLARAKQTVDPTRAAEYEAAADLQPHERSLADKARGIYDKWAEKAAEYGIDLGYRKNYVNHEQDLGGTWAGLLRGGKKFSTSFQHTGERTHESYFDSEQAGIKAKTKDLADLMQMYSQRLSTAIRGKETVRRMQDGRAKDGSPLLAQSGIVKRMKADDGNGKVTMVLPKVKPEDAKNYVRTEYPALQDWLMNTVDADGNRTLVKGDLLVHKEAKPYLDAMLGRSAIRNWWDSASETKTSAATKAVTKFLADDLVSMGKQTMVGFLSPMHMVAEGQHAAGHGVNPFTLESIDLVNNPEHLRAAQAGLALKPTQSSSLMAKEGVGGGSKDFATLTLRLASKALESSKIPLGDKAAAALDFVADTADSYQHFLFHEYIPSLKMQTFRHAEARNLERFAGEIKAGKLSTEDISHLTADQVNAAYGHLNYAALGRNPTLQHIFQLGLLAPDFLEARTRFAFQAGKSAVGSKAGHEQLRALMLIGATQVAGSKILSKVLGGDWHWDEPFAVVAGGRKYTMRTVPLDLWEAWHHPGAFVSNRIAPVVNTSWNMLHGENYRHERASASELLVDLVGDMTIPMTLQPFTRQMTESGYNQPISKFEQLLSSTGLKVSRFSPDEAIRSEGKAWMKTNGAKYGYIEDDRSFYSASVFRPVKYALEDSDYARAVSELQTLKTQHPMLSWGQLQGRVTASLIRPITGSNKTDNAFRESLDEHGKERFKAAVERQGVLRRRLVESILQASGQKKGEQNESIN